MSIAELAASDVECRTTVINRSFGQFFMLSGIVHGIRPVQSIGPFRAFSKCDTYHIHF